MSAGSGPEQAGGGRREGVRALVVMGVSGSGKTTVGRRVAGVLGWEFLDADSFHPPSNVAKMASGHPLSDADRAPWLQAMKDAIEQRLAAGEGVVLACSALRRTYRDVLRSAGPGVGFLYLRSGPDLVRSRVSGRGGHFFPAELVASQFDALEEPSLSDEPDVAVVDAAAPLTSYTRQRVDAVLGGLSTHEPRSGGADRGR